MPAKFALALLLAAAALQAHAHGQRPAVDALVQPTPAAPTAATPPALALKRFVFQPTGEPMGLLSTGPACQPQGELRFDEPTVNLLTRDLGRLARQELALAGYPRPAAKPAVAQGDDALQPVAHELIATLQAMQAEACINDTQLNGRVWLRMQWELRLAGGLQHAAVFASEAAVQTQGVEATSLSALAHLAMAQALRSLLAQTCFIRMLANWPVHTEPDQAAQRCLH